MALAFEKYPPTETDALASGPTETDASAYLYRGLKPTIPVGNLKI
jgi:hypothetical protein